MGKANGKAKKTFLPDLPIKHKKGNPLNETVETLPPPSFRNLQELPDWLDGELHDWVDTAFHLTRSDPDLARLILDDIGLGVRAVAQALRTGRLTVMPAGPETPASRFVRAAQALLQEGDPCEVETAVAELLEAGERARVAQAEA